MSIAERLRQLIHERGPLTVAAFMDAALYDPDFGYYAGAAQRSGRAGDFFTSVDVGSLFGELLEIQIAEMATQLEGDAHGSQARGFDLVEAGAGNGRLSADILRAARLRDPLVYVRTRLHLVEASAKARAAAPGALAETADRLVSASASLPSAFEGVLVANELLDALPAHQIVMRDEGLREVYVDFANGRFVAREGPLSTSDLAAYFDRLDVSLEPGWRAEVNLQAIAWIREVAARLTRGFVVLIDYGHEARELYSASHSGGTLTTFSRHVMSGAEASGQPSWLERPGEQDITAHVDFTSVKAAARAAGLQTIGFLDQTYFLMGVASRLGDGSMDDLGAPAQMKRRLALKTLLMPGGLGSTQKVLILGKDVGTPSLCGCSYRMRIT